MILGKTNLSEWANFRSFFAASGWSAVGGQTHNPYGLDHNPCGSSSGSGAAVSANFTAVSLGTETDGSIVCPANANGVVGIKPTTGLTSRAGVVPISHTQDTVGPHGRTVADAAVTLGVIQSRTFDGRDAATGGVPLGWQGRFTRPNNIPTDYTQFLNPKGLQGARLGVTRQGIDSAPAPVIAAFESVLTALRAAGATVIELDGANASVSPAFTFPLRLARRWCWSLISKATCRPISRRVLAFQWRARRWRMRLHLTTPTPQRKCLSGARRSLKKPRRCCRAPTHRKPTPTSGFPLVRPTTRRWR